MVPLISKAKFRTDLLTSRKGPVKSICVIFPKEDSQINRHFSLNYSLLKNQNSI